MSASASVAITTDTATACLFDLAALKHRKDDVGDWWSIPAGELTEINLGNALILNLGSDGDYTINVGVDVSADAPRYHLRAPSGRIFVGPGEELPGAGLEPDGSWGGAFIDVPPGLYVCAVQRRGAEIDVRLEPGGTGANTLTDLIRL